MPSPLPTLPTPTLTLHPLNESHLPFQLALDSQPLVTKFLYPHPRTQDEILQAHTRRLTLTNDPTTGCGYWVASLIASSTPIGLFMLLPPDDTKDNPSGQVELGYRLVPEFWRKGFAVEGSKAVLEYAFGLEGVEVVYARTSKVNEGSWRTMEKLGMRFVGRCAWGFDEGVPGKGEGEVEYAVGRGGVKGAQDVAMTGGL